MSRSIVAVLIAVAALTPIAAAPPALAAPAGLTDDVGAVVVAGGLSSVVDVEAPVGDPRLFVVERAGRVRIIADGNVTTFLDITDRVLASGGEQGLLGIAFPSDHATTGEFYLNYTARPDGRSVVSEFSLTADPDVADPASERELLSVAQPATNHNGGALEFGNDGHLLVALGDGGGGGDPFGNGQNKNTILGAILRITRDGDPAPGNPFIGSPGDDRIWAWGLRNPWRIDVDQATGDVWIGDVGQDSWEEVDRIPAGVGGLNFGWNTREGDHCFSPSSGCGSAGLTPPVVEYAHGPNPCSASITGGVVYRGNAIPKLRGHYFYADFCKQFIRSVRLDGSEVTDATNWTAVFGIPGGLTTFGTDGFGEMYMATFSTLYRMVSTAGPDCDIDGDARGDVVVGVPGEHVGGVADSGAVHVFYGSPGGLNPADDQLIHQDTTGVPGNPRRGDEFGAAVACADFDGDGFDDVVVGMPGKRIGDARKAGAVLIVPGGAAGLDATRSVRFHQDTTDVANKVEKRDRFGAALAVGDFDRDGRVDLAVGVPGERIGGPRTGAVHVFAGNGAVRPRGVDRLFSQGRSGVPGVAQTDDLFGHALAAGDFDGDGDDDLAVGVPGEPGGGAVQLLRGRSSGLAATGQLRTAPGVAELGASLAAGPVGVDGFDDLVAGAPGSDGESGAVVVFRGTNAGLRAGGTHYRQGDGLWNVPEQGDRFGAAVALGDLSGRHRGDLLIGVPGEGGSGLVHVLFAGANVPSRAGDRQLKPGGGLPGTAGDYGMLGAAVGAADVDGDGDDDVLLGDPADGGQVVVVPVDGGLVIGSSFAFDQDTVGVASKRSAGDRFGGAL